MATQGGVISVIDGKEHWSALSVSIWQDHDSPR
jgi:hypothetical protein